MKLVVENRISKKTQKPYMCVVLYKGSTELVLSFDKEACAVLTDGEIYTNDILRSVVGTITEYEMTKKGE